MIRRLFSFASLLLVLTLSACATQPGFTGRPTALTGQEKLAPNMAVVLVGVTGPARMTYMQLTHGSLPSLNVNFAPSGNSIVAIPVPAGVTKLSLSSYTVEGRPGSYVGSMAFGYIPLHSAEINIEKAGVYFLATVDTSKPLSYAKQPLPGQLQEARVRLGGVLDGREPVNFVWP